MSQDQDQGSFLTGFTLGIFAGAAGYFLFGTDKGHRVRSEWQREWEVAKADLERQAAGDSAQAVGLTLRQALYSVGEWLGAFAPAEVTSSAARKSKAKPKQRSSKSRFKGV